ncbi:hypothetical protein [Acidovorax sp. 106]|uniref:hypothetical protein n=1 Tax=Acidovorax sp. 106 TaxID=2135637 RepID=UPI001F25DAAE|nr:hypothetical protein [Acidovorax sp. 106]
MAARIRAVYGVAFLANSVLLAAKIALYAIPIRATTSSPESCKPSLQRAGLAVVAFGVVLTFANAHYLHHRGR